MSWKVYRILLGLVWLAGTYFILQRWGPDDPRAFWGFWIFCAMFGVALLSGRSRASERILRWISWFPWSALRFRHRRR